MNESYSLVLPSATLFSNNMGCNALSYAAVELLDQVASRLKTKFEYYLVGNPSDGVIPFELESQRIHLVENLPYASPRGILRGLCRHTLRKQFSQRRSIGKCDIFLDHAWGDSFSDIYGRERIATVMRQFGYARDRNKPLILLPQTIGPFQDISLNCRISGTLESAAVVYARDPLSVACAKELCPHVDVVKTVDMALFLPYVQRKRAGHARHVVGVNPSGLLWRGGYTRSNQFGLKADYASLIRRLVGFLLSIEDVSVELVGHDIRGPSAGNEDDDYYVCKLIQREFPQCRIAPFFYSPIEAKSYISGLDLLIGSRMHCCIAAYSSGVPVVPLAYSRKFKGLFVDELAYPHLVELTEDDGEGLVHRVNDVLKRLDSIRSEMPDRMRAIELYRMEFVNDLTRRIGECLGLCL